MEENKPESSHCMVKGAIKDVSACFLNTLAYTTFDLVNVHFICKGTSCFNKLQVLTLDINEYLLLLLLLLLLYFAWEDQRVEQFYNNHIVSSR